MMEISTLPALIQHLEKSYPGCALRFESIANSAGGASVTLTIEKADKTDSVTLDQIKVRLEAAATEVIKYQRKALKEKETRLQLQGEVKQLNSVVDKLIMRPSQNIQIQGDIQQMGDTYHNEGQVGAMGPNANAHDNTFNQLVNHLEKTIDLNELAGELLKLREAMRQEAAEPDQFSVLTEVAKAEEAAKEGDSSKVVKSLKAAGQWALDAATKIGTTIAAEAIKKSMGM